MVLPDFLNIKHKKLFKRQACQTHLILKDLYSHKVYMMDDRILLS